jgi:hypothetical protein
MIKSGLQTTNFEGKVKNTVKIAARLSRRLNSRCLPCMHLPRINLPRIYSHEKPPSDLKNLSIYLPIHASHRTLSLMHAQSILRIEMTRENQLYIDEGQQVVRSKSLYIPVNSIGKGYLRSYMETFEHLAFYPGCHLPVYQGLFVFCSLGFCIDRFKWYLRQKDCVSSNTSSNANFLQDSANQTVSERVSSADDGHVYRTSVLVVGLVIRTHAPSVRWATWWSTPLLLQHQ